MNDPFDAGFNTTRSWIEMGGDDASFPRPPIHMENDERKQWWSGHDKAVTFEKELSAMEEIKNLKIEKFILRGIYVTVLGISMYLLSTFNLVPVLLGLAGAAYSIRELVK